MIVRMITEQQIANLIRRLAEGRSWKVSYAARVVSGSGDTVERIEGGMGLTLRRANQIIARAASEWPTDHTWPADIPRPVSSQPEKEVPACTE